jgi:uncharacterized protein
LHWRRRAWQIRAVTRPLILWLLGDGKPGHENQSLGLAEALARRVPAAIHRIELAASRGVISRVRAAVAAARGLPRPDAIIAAGHSTHAALLWLARKYDARGIVLMRPTLPSALFDHVIAPEHDFKVAPAASRIIPTKGALNRIVPADGPREGKLVLIGGPSRTHGWDGGTLVEMLAKTTDRGGWDLTDSRRTPPGFIEEARRLLPGVTFHPHGETGPGWLAERLGKAREVWVTEDSVSMVYEALSGGGRVGLLPVPRIGGRSRVVAGIGKLVEEGYVTPFARWLETGRLAVPPAVLGEADRCAALLDLHCR